MHLLHVRAGASGLVLPDLAQLLPSIPALVKLTVRDEAPVHFAKDTSVWCVSRYDDVMFVLNNPEIFSSRAMFSFLMNQGREGRPPISLPMLSFVARFAWKTRLNPFEFATARMTHHRRGEAPEFGVQVDTLETLPTP